MKAIPGGSEILREALIVVAGAAIAALLLKMAPKDVQDWFRIS